MPNQNYDDLMKMVGKKMQDEIEDQIKREFLLPLDLTASTYTKASAPAESITLDSLMETWHQLMKDIQPPSIKAFIITHLVPPGGYEIKVDGEKYIFINIGTWKEWEPQIEKVVIHSIAVSISGIPVFESDAMAAEILGKIMTFSLFGSLRDPNNFIFNKHWQEIDLNCFRDLSGEVLDKKDIDNDEGED